MKRPKLKFLGAVAALLTVILLGGFWLGQAATTYFAAIDPTGGPGVPAPLWSLLVRTDVPSIYAHTGNGVNDWTLLGNVSGTGVNSIADDGHNSLAFSGATGTVTAGVNWSGLGATAYQRLMYDGTNALAGDNLTVLHHAIEQVADWAGPDSSVTDGEWTCAVTGGTCVCTTGSDTRPGLCTLATSTSATGHARMNSNRVGLAMSATDPQTVEWIGVAIPTLDNGTDTFDVDCGFGDQSNVTEPVDGAYFLYHATTGGGAGGTNSADWQIGVAKGGTRSRATLDGSTTDTVLRVVTAGDDSVSPETGQVTNLKVTCTTARCDFYMQRMGTDSQYVRVGSACSSGCSMPATNIPAAGVTNQFGTDCSITKWGAATLNRSLFVDAVGYRRPFSAGR